MAECGAKPQIRAMLPIRPEPEPAKARELLEKIGSELFDDEDDAVRDFVEHRRPVTGDRRQRFVRHFANRWGEFHKDEEDHDAEVGRFFVAMIRPFGVATVVAFLIWIGQAISRVHFQLDFPPVRLDVKTVLGLALMLGAGILWAVTRRKGDG